MLSSMKTSDVTRMSPFTVRVSIGESVLIPTLPPSLMIMAKVPSSTNLAISASPVCITSKAGPVPSLEIANRSVICTCVSIVCTVPKIRRSPVSCRLLQ